MLRSGERTLPERGGGGGRIGDVCPIREGDRTGDRGIADALTVDSPLLLASLSVVSADESDATLSAVAATFAAAALALDRVTGLVGVPLADELAEVKLACCEDVLPVEVEELSVVRVTWARLLRNCSSLDAGPTTC